MSGPDVRVPAPVGTMRGMDPAPDLKTTYCEAAYDHERKRYVTTCDRKKDIELTFVLFPDEVPGGPVTPPVKDVFVNGCDYKRDPKTGEMWKFCAGPLNPKPDAPSAKVRMNRLKQLKTF